MKVKGQDTHHFYQQTVNEYVKLKSKIQMGKDRDISYFVTKALQYLIYINVICSE